MAGRVGSLVVAEFGVYGVHNDLNAWLELPNLGVDQLDVEVQLVGCLLIARADDADALVQLGVVADLLDEELQSSSCLTAHA